MQDTPTIEISAFLEKLAQLAIDEPETEVNFFSVGGSGYLENPTSDLLALFMGWEPSAPRWLARALVTHLARLGQADEQLFAGTDWSKVRASREVSAWDDGGESHKRLDLVVSDGNFVLGIENKVYAAVDNPFSVYDKLLRQRSRGGPILRCILHATPDSRPLPRNCKWPVVSYSELVEVALSQYGADVVLSPVSKWQVLYREFLLHLRHLSQPSPIWTMNEANLTFALENLPSLIKASELLVQLESGLRRAGTTAIEQVFLDQDVETTIRTGVANWAGNEKVLRFFPKVWGGESQVVLVYLPDTENARNGSIRFYVTAYIDRSTTRADLDKVERQFGAATKKNSHAWVHVPGENLTWFESNRRILALSAWAREESKEGALAALADLAMWVHRHVFS
ncbi:PD-(D/E)XK nuclease family protein [Paraburkholderia pallida]|uniref:PDDEXK-like family protein n=1 Tax=Paraburkholderia pallida TaxID=2547399 RepID=UPI00143011C3|nr:PD-(D/E)XK nuclease family protein [Paraburkholderia pallida]